MTRVAPAGLGGRARRPGRRALPLVFALVLAACGGGSGDDATSPTSAPPPTVAETTTTEAPPAPSGPIAPLTGLPADAALLGRPALVVKIDNAPKGRPQAGINQADVVVAEKVEDGITRLFTVFHSADADPVGPVRSARSTDIVLAGALNRPLFAYSGTNAAFQALVNAAPLVDVGHTRAAPAYRRQSGRPAPYNLFSSTPALFGRAPAGAGPPSPLFRYRAAGAAPAGGSPAAGVRIQYVGANVTTVVEYAWDPAAGGWARTQNGTAHVDAAGAQVAPANVVVQFAEYRDTGQRDTSGAEVPEAHLVGEGEVWVLTAGQLIRGRWSRPSEQAPTSWAHAGGPIELTPGRTWVELPLPGSAAPR